MKNFVFFVSNFRLRESPSMKVRTTLLGLVFLLVSGACTPNRRIVESTQTPAPNVVNASPVVSSFEDDLQAMRNADFKFILVFRRKDGAAMDRDDRAFVNANTPPDANRKMLSDDGKAIIIGSNFPFFPGTVVSLTERFVMEDYSKPDSGPIEVDRTAKATQSPTANK